MMRLVKAQNSSSNEVYLCTHKKCPWVLLSGERDSSVWDFEGKTRSPLFSHIVLPVGVIDLASKTIKGVSIVSTLSGTYMIFRHTIFF